MAYYAAFDRFGYKYILNPNLDWIRKAIVDPQDKVLPYKAAFYSGADLMSVLPGKPEFAIAGMYFGKVRVPIFFINHLMVFLPPFPPHSTDSLRNLYSQAPNRRIELRFDRKTGNPFMTMGIEMANNTL